MADWDKILEEERQRSEETRKKRVEKQDRYEDHENACNQLTPQGLADQLQSALDLTDFDSLGDIAARLKKQSGVLDAVFYTSLHQAGLGFEHKLEKEATQTALIAQRQCRQTFSTLKNITDKETSS